MNRHIKILFSLIILLVSTTAFPQNGEAGQKPINLKQNIGKIYLSNASEHLEFLTERKLYSSINWRKDTASFFVRNDTLFIEQDYGTTNGIETIERTDTNDYKIIYVSPDTIRLINNYRHKYKPENWEDTLTFINIENCKEPVTNFTYLKLNISSPWNGKTNISIDKTGNVFFSHVPIPTPRKDRSADKNTTSKTITGQLTKDEFAHFKDILSKAMVSRLAIWRNCPIDGAIAKFEILIDDKGIRSTGCDLTWTQTHLLYYLWDIAKNKGLVKIKSHKAVNTSD